MNRKFRILYPQYKLVSCARIFVWALDAADNHKTIKPSTLAEAFSLLEDIGEVTFADEILRFLMTEEAHKVVKHWDLFTGEITFFAGYDQSRRVDSGQANHNGQS